MTSGHQGFSNYEIRIAETLDDLEQKVRAYIKSGWIPVGGIGTHQSARGVVEYYQAMAFPKPAE